MSEASGRTPGSPETEALENGSAGPRLWNAGTFAGLVLAVGLLVAMAIAVDFDAVWRDLKAADKRLIALATLCHYAALHLRGVRWHRALLHLKPTAGSGKFGLLVFFTLFVDNLVPGKLAELYSAHLVRINAGIRRSAALGSLVFLRMLDAWMILLLAAASSWVVFSQRVPDELLWVLLFGLATAGALTLGLVAFLAFRGRAQERLPDLARQMIAAFREGMWPHRGELLAVGSLTVLLWTLESLWMLFLAMSFDVPVSAVDVVFLMTIPALASAFPLTPAGTGAVELTLYGSLRAVGASSTTAASFTVLNRLIDYWLHNVLGVLVWAGRRKLGLRTWRDVSTRSPDAPPVAFDPEARPRTTT